MTFALVALLASPLSADDAAGFAQSTLAVIFGLSGVVKLRKPLLAAMAIVDFGIGSTPRVGLGYALGTVETVLAVALALHVTPPLTVVASAILLVVFLVLVARALASGQRFACFCFGDADAAISAWSFVRTAALAAVAVVLAIATVAGGAKAEFGNRVVWDAVAGLSVVAIIALVAGSLRVERLARDVRLEMSR